MDNKELQANIVNIKKPRPMIQTNVKELNLIQRKAINYFIYILQKDGDKKNYISSLGELKNICGISVNEGKYLKEQLREISDIRVEYNYLKKDKNKVWETMIIFPYIAVEYGTGKITFEVVNAIKEKILNPEIYSPINLVLIASLKSKYSVVLYEFIRDYVDSPKIPILTIKDLRLLLGLSPEKYKRFPDFRRKVLKVAIEEINEKTDLKCSYELIMGYRRTYSHIQFKVEKIKKYSHVAIEESKKEPKEIVDKNNKELDTFVKEIINYLHLKAEKVLDLVNKYGRERIKLVFEHVKESETVKNPAGFFITALKDTYEVLTPEDKALKEKISALKIEARKCFANCKGGCSSNFIDAKKEKYKKSCYWCKKMEKLRLEDTKDKLEFSNEEMEALKKRKSESLKVIENNPFKRHLEAKRKKKEEEPARH